MSIYDIIKILESAKQAAIENSDRFNLDFYICPVTVNNVTVFVDDYFIFADDLYFKFQGIEVASIPLNSIDSIY